jgi:putative SOS response-associated peptidase YedK
MGEDRNREAALRDALADRGLMALAGLWENWKSPEGEWMRSFAIITTAPNELCARLHNRMPVVLKPEAWLCFGTEAGPHPMKSKVLSCFQIRLGGGVPIGAD